MRELSARERAFLDRNLPEGHHPEDEAPARPRGGARSQRSRLGDVLGAVLSYLPLAIGVLTLSIAGLATYLYIWGRDFFKLSELEKLSSDGTLALMDSTSGGWLAGTLQFFSVAPWIILGIVVVGILLMGLSMLLVRKRNG